MTFLAEALALFHSLIPSAATAIANISSNFAPLLASQHGLQHYLHTHYGDRTFEHLYRWNAFDTALLIPYFVVMIILAFYGMHRYQLVYLYYKHKKNAADNEPPARFAELPCVTVQLPIFNEQYVIDRLIDACCRSSTRATGSKSRCSTTPPTRPQQVAQRDLSSAIARSGIPSSTSTGPIATATRPARSRQGLKTATGEFIAIFDADFVPPPDWLMQVVHHFADPGIGMVQTRWTHLNRDYSFLTQVEAILLDGHFVLEHGGRSRAGVFFNFNGTAGMWRRAAIDEAGGWQHDTLTEDTDLSYRAQLKGWKFMYLQDVECPAELPIEMTAFKTQQARWAKGLIQTSKKILPQVFRSDVPFHTKIEACYHLTANISYPLMVVLSALLMPAMIIRFYQGWFQMLLIDLPLFMASTFSISSFYLVSQRELYPRSWSRPSSTCRSSWRSASASPSPTPRAVLEALFGIKSAFTRTPKYRVEKKGEESQATKYRKRLGVIPWIEMLIGCYFALTIWYAISNENYFTVPFLLLFVVGYWYTGLLSLLQGRFERLRTAAPTRKSPRQSPSR